MHTIPFKKISVCFKVFVKCKKEVSPLWWECDGKQRRTTTKTTTKTTTLQQTMEIGCRFMTTQISWRVLSTLLHLKVPCSNPTHCCRIVDTSNMRKVQQKHMRGASLAKEEIGKVSGERKTKFPVSREDHGSASKPSGTPVRPWEHNIRLGNPRGMWIRIENPLFIGTCD